VVGVGEGSSVSVDVVSGLDLTSLHSVDEQTHLPFSLSISLCNALLSISLFTLLMSKFVVIFFFSGLTDFLVQYCSAVQGRSYMFYIPFPLKLSAIANIN